MTGAEKAKAKEAVMSNNWQIVADAIQSRRAAVVRVRRRDGSETFDIFLTGDGRGRGDDGIWAELITGEPASVDRLINNQETVEVFFKCSDIRVYFETTVMRRHKQMLRRDRILLGWPINIRIEEKRRGTRERLVEEVSVQARLMTPEGDVALRVHDLSPTGVGLLWPDGVSAPTFKQGQHLQLSLIFYGQEHRIAVEHRTTRSLPGGAVRLGLRFTTDAQGSARLLEHLEHLLDELRHKRMIDHLGNALGMFAA